jgi:hypothetical protein
MAQATQGSKRKRSKTALHLWGTAGFSLAMAGSASANAPAVEGPSPDSGKRILLAEEEIADVSLATFYVFDREREFSPGVRLAAGRGGCGGCGCGGHGCGGCAAHVGGCGGHPGGCGGCGCSAHHGCRGCGGCGSGLGSWIGGCGGCGGGCGTCWVWDPVLLHWVYVCY